MFNERVQRADARRATRARVLRAAEKLFRDNGFAATTVRRISAEAEVSVGTVMGVGDKDALLVAIIDEWIGDVHDARADDAPLPALTVDQAVHTIVTNVAPFVAYFSADSDLAREYAAILARGQHPNRTFTGRAVRLVADFEDILRAASYPTPDAGARALYLIYIGYLFASSGGAFDAAEAQRRFAEAIRQVLGTGVPHDRHP